MFDSDSDLPWEDSGNGEEEVLHRTEALLPLAVRVVDSPLACDGQVAVEIWLSGHYRISQCIINSEEMPFLLSVLQDPVYVGMRGRRKDGGIAAEVLALVPPARARSALLTQEPWLESAPHYDEGGFEMTPVFLGKVVRFPQDCRHGDDLSSEVADIFSKLLRGSSQPALDRFLDGL